MPLQAGRGSVAAHRQTGDDTLYNRALVALCLVLAPSERTSIVYFRMLSIHRILALCLFCLTFVSAQLHLTAQLFQLASSNDVNSVKLAWGPVNAGSFEVQRGTASGSLTSIGTVTGDEFEDYDLRTGGTYFYKITSSNGESNEVSVKPFSPTGNYSTYDNTQASSLVVKSAIQANGVYYSYSVIGPRSGFVIVERTSSDGYSFTGNTTVLTSDVICKPIGEACHLESVQINQHPGTGEVVMWAHLENNQNYNLGQVAAAHGTPGQQWTFDG
jgi:hypothetical protein